MRVSNVDIYVPNSPNINLSFKDLQSLNSYNITDITGLDADEITSKFYGDSTISNESYYELSMRSRDVILKIGLNPNYSTNETVSELRDRLYRFISSSRTGVIQLQFRDGETVVATVSGFVTKFESLLFTKLPEIQLTITCSDPMLRSPNEVNFDVSEMDPAAIVITDEESTAPHGFRFAVIFDAPMIDFSIQDGVDPTWAFEVNLSGSPLGQFNIGDELHFSSEHNNRYLLLVRDLTVKHLVDRIVPTSVWPILFPNVNNFTCSPGADLDYITHYPTYWGV